MLVAHVESAGVWLVEGGMYRLAAALCGLAAKRGVTVRYDADVAGLVVSSGRAGGVRLQGGERIDADAVVVTADAAALGLGLFGSDAARAVAFIPETARSLSAMTWSCVAPAKGFPLLHHSVFFSNDYRAEFDSLFRRRRMPEQPTVYVCAQDRDDRPAATAGEERLFILANAPATGDRHRFEHEEIGLCASRVFSMLQRCGLTIETAPHATRVTTPTDFNKLFPGTGGALYGRASHGWKASFQRPGMRTALPGLYLAGGSVHPGPGVPMAALSGRMAAASLAEDLASTVRFRQTAMRGGTSMP